MTYFCSRNASALFPALTRVEKRVIGSASTIFGTNVVPQNLQEILPKYSFKLVKKFVYFSATQNNRPDKGKILH